MLDLLNRSAPLYQHVFHYLNKNLNCLLLANRVLQITHDKFRAKLDKLEEYLRRVLHVEELCLHSSGGAAAAGPISFGDLI
jgi:hypothetical protein